MKHVEIIKLAMAEKNISQSELSRKTGMNQSNLSLFLNGKRPASLKNIEKMFQVLDINFVIN
ncbi:MAG TPA: helix-turn-helix transcriptional regulator [Bacteroidales bacterium]|nr:helix-turn-helix transcriptional regulator [Bacteroidales bacterium]